MTPLQRSTCALTLALAALAALAGGCASTGPEQAPAAARAELSCMLPSNCVNSLGSSGFAPLRIAGDAVQALAALQATLATFSEASVVRAQGLEVEVVFTTPVGFRDRVDFRIDPAGGRIDYRSRSLFGLFDFGKNRARMREFIVRFEADAR